MRTAIPPAAAAPVILLAGILLLSTSCASNPRLERLPPAPAPSGGRIVPADPWPMHTVDNPNLRLPNGLEGADADSDGRLDLLTNYEWNGDLRIAFGPPREKIRQPWPAVTLGRISNAESSCFGDVDGDGDQDVVAVHGAEALARPGVAVLLNPGGSRARDPGAWGKPIELPAAAGIGHLHYVRCRDLDGDGQPEIVIGGRGSRHRPGLRFLGAPPGPRGSFEPGVWTITAIDAGIESGHGFVFGDLDGDGDQDIALANSDWNTEPGEQLVAWYENPGPGHLREAGAWKKRILYKAPDFYTKEQLALADVDADGRVDIVAHLENALYLFWNRGPAEGPAGGAERAAPLFERIVIPKPDEARFRSRMLRLADVDGDSRLEVVGALIHRAGSLPADRAAVFWMDVDWLHPGGPAATRPIKWGSGFRGTGPLNGEKWDQAVLADLDGDGDLDLAADCEEFHRGSTVHLAVVWFENPLGEGPE